MKAYLSYPITLTVAGQRVEAHLTIKYIGSAPYTVEDIDARLAGVGTKFAGRFMCKPTKFAPTVHVLELTVYDHVADRVRAAVDSLAPNDYPTWRPHITVPKEVWKAVRDQSLAFTEVSGEAGPLTLKDNGVVVKTWGNDVLV